MTARWYNIKLKTGSKEKRPFCYARLSHTHEGVQYVAVSNGAYRTDCLPQNELRERYEVTTVVPDARQEQIEHRYDWERGR